MANSSINGILPLKNGGIVFGSADPGFGVLEAEGSRTLFVAPSIADYRGNQVEFAVSPDSKTIQFGYDLMV